MCDLCVRKCNAIGELTNEECEYVTILAPNADFDGPGFAVDVSGPWTGYQERRFSSDDSTLACLEAAVEARRAASREGGIK